MHTSLYIKKTDKLKKQQLSSDPVYGKLLGNTFSSMLDLPSIKLFKEKYNQFFRHKQVFFLHVSTWDCNTIAVSIYFLLIEIYLVK